MNLLLDTHTLIWFSENSPQLSATALDAIELETNSKFVSTSTFWEIAIKASLGKLHLTQPLAKIVREIENSDAFILPVLAAHALKIEWLPLLHRDPFDRMLIAQALAEDFTLVSNETLFDQYGVKRLW
jgi:PIN domain nuclease of toxin-antitoxin system